MFAAALGAAQAASFPDSIVQIRAVSVDGSIMYGSGVMTESGRVATACHCTRGASRIEIVHGAKRWIADGQVGSEHHDMCLLAVPAIDVPKARLRRSDDLRSGESVTAVGFQGGDKLVVGHGRIAALYWYDEGHVIRTTAPFDFGSSGGGLFDEDGHLIGVLAFKARSGENLRFALPSDWLAGGKVASTFAPIAAGSSAPAFWERPRDERPAFLGAALQEGAAH